MKSLMLLALCAFAGAALANETAVVKVYSLSVQERIQNLEVINVTAEKKQSDEAEQPDEVLAAILEEVEEIEVEE